MACYPRPFADVPLVYVLPAGWEYTEGTSNGTVLLTRDEPDVGSLTADPSALAFTITDPVHIDLWVDDLAAPPLFVVPPSAQP